jgi:hypothetical protein
MVTRALVLGALTWLALSVVVGIAVGKFIRAGR